MLSNVRWLLSLLVVGACGFSVPDQPVDAPSESIDAPPDVITVSWAVDSTSGKAVPANAVEWTAFLKEHGLSRIAAPSGLWLLQEPVGPLVDSIGTVVLTPFGSPSQAQPVPGWTRKGVGVPDGSNSGFGNKLDTALPNVMTQSMTALTLVVLPSGPPGALRTVMVEGSSSLDAFARADVSPAKRLEIRINTTSATGTQDPGTTAAGLMLKLDVTHGEQKVITRKETVALTNTPLTTSRGLYIGGAANPAPDAKWLYLVAWYGAKAEITDADARALLTALDW
jgi:hypothetical protein